MGQSKPPEKKLSHCVKNSGETVPLQIVPMCMYARSFSSKKYYSLDKDFFEFE